MVEDNVGCSFVWWFLRFLRWVCDSYIDWGDMRGQGGALHSLILRRSTFKCKSSIKFPQLKYRRCWETWNWCFHQIVQGILNRYVWLPYKLLELLQWKFSSWRVSQRNADQKHLGDISCSRCSLQPGNEKKDKWQNNHQNHMPTIINIYQHLSNSSTQCNICMYIYIYIVYIYMGVTQ